jgi:hypothetical protein
MSDRQLDELFGEGEGTPVPRTGRVNLLLAVGLVLAAAGLACSSAPGGLLVLAAYAVSETDARRVENGYLPADAAATVKRTQQHVFAGIVVVLALFAVQAALLCGGVYDVLWGELLMWVGERSGR